MLPALLRARAAPARPGDAQRGRGVGADGDDRPAVAARRASTCASPSSRRRASTPSLRVFVDAVVRDRRRRQPARRRALVGGVRRRRAHRGRHRAARQGSAAARSAPAAAGSPIDRADLQRGGRGARRTRDATQQLSGAEMLRLALGLEDSPLAGGISIEGGGWAADLLAAARDVAARTGARAEGLRRPAAQLPGRGARVARLPRRRRPRRLPRARHGPRQDADDARAPARRARATGPRW